ncbi:hypothetical protein [Desulfurispira natronophila]|uniref:Uncharacterized protein n=1 Tax=Desulfurispira natronophila TaxID=682562 RepID=A0A7W7Y6S2_9BACT|nr:hypothetical protein [Desulfurispira natronophila]MBB5022767.1 hypothetical protein [Desulfurispira natronophila]
MFRTALLSALIFTVVSVATAEILTVESTGVTLPGQGPAYKSLAIDRSRAKAVLSTITSLTRDEDEVNLSGITPVEALEMAQSFVEGYSIVNISEEDLLYQVHIAWNIDQRALESILFSRTLSKEVHCTILLYRIHDTGILWDTLDTLQAKSDVSMDKVLVMDDNKAMIALRTMVAPQQMLADLRQSYRIDMDNGCHVTIDKLDDEQRGKTYGH